MSEGDEFDLLANAPDEPEIRPPTVFQAHKPAASTATGTAAQNDIDLNNFEDFDDSRMKTLQDMGFSVEEARQALVMCNHDVNEALNLLLGNM